MNNPSSSSIPTKTMAFSDENSSADNNTTNTNDNDLSFPFQLDTMSSVFDVLPCGFTDFLGVSDLGPSLSEWLSIDDDDTPVNHPLPSPPSSSVPESSEMVNTTSPNSASISWSSNEATANNNNNSVKQQSEKAGNKREAGGDGDGCGAGGNGDSGDVEDEDKIIKKLKPTTIATTFRSSRRKDKVVRFAFMTKSDVDHLDDGFRWRKYGQKAVKNSPYPRSYYRCTSMGCGVKKRVERSSEDPTHVITTYEGQHNHACPPTPTSTLGSHRYNRHACGSKPTNAGAGDGASGGGVNDGVSGGVNGGGGNGGVSVGVNGGGDIGSQRFVPLPKQLYHHQQQQKQNVQQAAAPLLHSISTTPSLSVVSAPITNYMVTPPSISVQDRDVLRGGFGVPSRPSRDEDLLKDTGLLEDIVYLPMLMRQEGKTRQ